MKPFRVLVHFSNGHISTRDFAIPTDALNYCRYNISHTGSVIRIEIDTTQIGGGVRAVWDSSWNEQSKATLWKNYK